MAERFYINCPLVVGAEVQLLEPEAHHLAVVCRIPPGADVCLFNGDGQEYPSRVAAVARRSVRLVVEGVARPNRELAFFLEVAAPLPKGDRGQFLIEKLTELGCGRFVPLICRRSVVLPEAKKLGKWQRYVIEASKQCRRNVLMELAEPQPWATYCQGASSQAIKIVAHPGKEGSPLQEGGGFSGTACLSQAVSVAVGPEGGFTDEEIELAQAAGWKVLNMGPRILRIETAALTLAAWAGAGLFHREKP